MKTELLHKERMILPALAAIVSFLLLLSPMRMPEAAAFSGTPFCSAPPMPGSGVKPNLLLMIDNSASMYDLAYSDPANYCIDDSYDDAESYPGYFDQGAIYSYGFGFTAQKFTASVLKLPNGCNAIDKSYLCVNMKAGTTPRKVDKFLASGKFLNWLSMSKLDIEKLALTGGKFAFDANKPSGMLLAETRGCQGKRFVKLLKEAPQLTFAVRGPNPSDGDYLYRASQGGGTRIEIYDKQYNKEACLKAVQDWQNAATPESLDSLRKDVNQCLGEVDLYDGVDPLSPTVKIPSKSKVYLDIMSNCYANPTAVLLDGTVLTDCAQRIKGKYSNNPSIVPRNGGEDICAAEISHPLYLHYDASGIPSPDSKGFLGKCYDSITGFPAASSSCATCCAEQEAQDYCRNISNPALTDPTVNSNVPSFILDAGIYTNNGIAASLRVRVAAPSQPSGLIQEFSPDVNFGAMVFNDDGAGSECKRVNASVENGGLEPGDIPCVKHCLKGATDSGRECQLDSDCAGLTGYRCREISATDGGKVISAISSSAGDHKSGLIASIGQVGANSWTPLAESFYNAMGYFANRNDLRLQPADFTGLPQSDYACQRNNVLIVTDGGSMADRHSKVNDLVAKAVQDWGVNGTKELPASQTTAAATDPAPVFQGSYNLDDLAWIARHKNLTDFAAPIANERDYLSTYVVYTGIPCGDYNPDGSCKTADEGAPEKLMQLAARKGGGKIANARSPADMQGAVGDMLQQIAAGSGTDASILSTGDGNGAIFLQEQFYPTKSFDGRVTSTSWIGDMQSLWYYIDPFLGNSAGAGSTVREDTDLDLKLKLASDRVVNFRNSGAWVFPDANGDGDSDDGEKLSVPFDALRMLWRAGVGLWQRPAADRTIYTQTNGAALASFPALGSDANALQLLQAKDASEAQRIISYVTGVDDPSYRKRTLAIPAGAVPGIEAAATNVWKLGDIVSSTPKVQSQVALGSYNSPRPIGYDDLSYGSFIRSNEYKNRGTVYVGANDGMLHAFNLGRLADSGSAGEVKASLDPKAGQSRADLGKEQWAFAPKNALPYLTYLKEPAYRHLYYVDGGVTLVDASIGDTNRDDCVKASYWKCEKPMSVVKSNQEDVSQNNGLDANANTWRTVLIGGMGLGGASGGACDVAGADAAKARCVPTPIADPAAANKRLGYSSYFALDVTDPDNPSLLWEFSDPRLGYSTTGPAIVRVGDPKTNGRWFAVFGSGPTGPIDASTRRFKGESRQELIFFAVDLRTGDAWTVATGIQNAFAGSMSGAAIDVDRRESDPAKGGYQDDALYVGYTRANSETITAASAWIAGGVVRILTKQNLFPDQWKASKVMDGIGPVTTGVARIQDRGKRNLWLYFGTGRYFFAQDDLQIRRSLYGVREPCYSYRDANRMDTQEPSCAASVTGGLIDQTTTQHALAANDPGWFINLDSAAGADGAERLVTTPSSIAAGAVFFPTFQPSADPCLPGASYLWGVKYDTGGAIPSGSLQGKVLVPLSNGSLQETGLSGSFTGKGGRRSPPMTGKPGGVKIVSNSGLRPLKKIIHMQER